MVNQKANSDAITPQDLQTGTHYYSSGQHLREKHRLEGKEFVDWCLALIPTWHEKSVLDAGGGWGRYIWELIDSEYVDVRKVVLTDISAGMLRTGRQEAIQRGISITTAICTIEQLPFLRSSFDIVMANKVLYHIEDQILCVKELARVLKPDGLLMATTNSSKIKAMIIDFHYQALQQLGIPFEPEPPSTFTMENGSELLETQFHNVETHYFESVDLIYDAALVRQTYESIGRYRNLINRNDVSLELWHQLPEVVEHIARDIIKRDGVLQSQNLMGAFICSHPL